MEWIDFSYAVGYNESETWTLRHYDNPQWKAGAMPYLSYHE